MEAKFSQRVKDVLTYSREEAVRLGNNYIGLEHLLLGIIREGEGVAAKLLQYFGVELKKFKKELEEAIKTPSNITQDAENIPLVKQAEKALKITYLEAKVFNSELIGTEHLLLAILKDQNNLVTSKLKNKGVSYEMVKNEVTEMAKDSLDLRKQISDKEKTDFKAELPGDLEDSSAGSGKPKNPKKAASKSKTPVLDNFGRDLKKAAEEDRLDPIVGRQKELERIAQILSRRKKNNPVLIGEPGVGKSAIAEGLALRINQRKVFERTKRR